MRQALFNTFTTWHLAEMPAGIAVSGRVPTETSSEALLVAAEVTTSLQTALLTTLQFITH